MSPRKILSAFAELTNRQILPDDLSSLFKSVYGNVVWLVRV